MINLKTPLLLSIAILLPACGAGQWGNASLKLEEVRKDGLLQKCRIEYATGTDKAALEFYLQKGRACDVTIYARANKIRAIEGQKESRKLQENLVKNLAEGAAKGAKKGFAP